MLSLKLSKAGLSSMFSSLTEYLTKAREPNLLYDLPIAEERKERWIYAFAGRNSPKQNSQNFIQDSIYYICKFDDKIW